MLKYPRSTTVNYWLNVKRGTDALGSCGAVVFLSFLKGQSALRAEQQVTVRVYPEACLTGGVNRVQRAAEHSSADDGCMQISYLVYLLLQPKGFAITRDLKVLQTGHMVTPMFSIFLYHPHPFD